MGRLISLFIVVVFASSCSTTDEHITSSYGIEGKVQNHKPGDAVILSVYDPVTQKRTPVDTSAIGTTGSYSLKYSFDEPGLFRMDFPERQNVMIAVDRGQDAIRIDAEGKRKGTLDIQGSEDSEKLLAYDAFRAASHARLVQPTYDARRDAEKRGDVEGATEAVRNYVHANELHRKELIEFTEENIGTSIALYGTMLRWTGDDSVDRLDALVRSFEVVHPNTKAAKDMRSKVERFKKVAIGAPAPDIKGPTPDGAILALSEMDAEYILIDFWASWCGPCISQVPALHSAHKEFNDRGFQILSVSVDTKEDKWKNAIDKYSLAWPHISDVKGWESPLARDYNVTFIPYNFLVDKNGVIVAKNLHATELYETVERLLESSENAG